MTAPQRPRLPSFIPESAPFSIEQRAWLNGLFAGVLGLEDGVTPLSSGQAALLMPGLLGAGTAMPVEADDSAPWHDPAMPLARPHEARRRQAFAAPADGGDGAAGLQPVRL